MPLFWHDVNRILEYLWGVGNRKDFDVILFKQLNSLEFFEITHGSII